MEFINLSIVFYPLFSSVYMVGQTFFVTSTLEDEELMSEKCSEMCAEAIAFTGHWVRLLLSVSISFELVSF